MAYSPVSETILPDSRFFEPLRTVSCMVDAVCFAQDMVQFGRVRSSPGDYANVQCCQFPMQVRLALVTPTLSTLPNVTVDGIEFLVEASQPATPSAGEPADYAVLLMHVISSIYVLFFERHLPWLRGNFGSDPYKWPPVFNFARAIRNFIVHHHGRVHFENPRAAAVSWFGLSYSPSDNGRLAVGASADLFFGDMLVLMAHLSAELDALGCPPDP